MFSSCLLGIFASYLTIAYRVYYCAFRINFLLFSSYYLHSISHPGKTGAPQVDLADDEETSDVSNEFSGQQLAMERVIIKTFAKYSICYDITDNFKVKLWRMGKKLAGLGGTKRLQLIEEWKDSSWSLSINANEENRQLKSRKACS